MAGVGTNSAGVDVEPNNENDFEENNVPELMEAYDSGDDSDSDDEDYELSLIHI